MKRTHAIFSGRVGQSCLGLSGPWLYPTPASGIPWGTFQGPYPVFFAYIMPIILTGVWSMLLACDGSLLDDSIPGLFVKLRKYSPVLYFM